MIGSIPLTEESLARLRVDRAAMTTCADTFEAGLQDTRTVVMGPPLDLAGLTRVEAR